MPQPYRHVRKLLRPAQLVPCALCGLMLLAFGCAPAGTRKTSSARMAKNVEASVPELSSRNQSLLAIYSAEIESTADRIIRESSVPATRRSALEWKTEAIPVMQASLLKTDPIAATLDTWAFIFQMKTFMAKPSQRQTLGQFYPIVEGTLSAMDAKMEQVIRSDAPKADIAMVRQTVSDWADAHPIDASLVGRQSIDPVLIRRAKETELGTRASIKALAESIGDLTARLDSYNVYAPKQARWQAELLLSDLTRYPEVGAGLSNLDALSKSATKATDSIDKLPELASQTREAVRTDVEGQRLSAQAFLRQERLETLDDLRQERIATMASLHGERLAATADLRGERQAVMASLREDEVEVMKDLNLLSDRTVQQLDATGRRLIDHFFIRALELMLLTLVLCFLAAWVLVRWLLPNRAR